MRKVGFLPVITGFKPYGEHTREEGSGNIFLHYEEFESIRLCDYERMNHHQAAMAMGVSRPTLTRIYAKARMKMARALVEGRQVIIEGGKIYFDSEWYTCLSCQCFFNHSERGRPVNACPLCGSHQFNPVNNQHEDSNHQHR